MNITVNFPEKKLEHKVLAGRLRAYAKKERRAVSFVIRDAIREYLEERDASQMEKT